MDSAASNGVEATTAGDGLAELERDLDEFFERYERDLAEFFEPERRETEGPKTREEWLATCSVEEYFATPIEERMATRTPKQLAAAAEHARRGLEIKRRLLAQEQRRRDRVCARLGIAPADFRPEHYPLLAERLAMYETAVARERETLAYAQAHTRRESPRPPAPPLTRILTRAAPRERRERRRSRRTAATRAGPDPDLADEPEPPSRRGEAA